MMRSRVIRGFVISDSLAIEVEASAAASQQLVLAQPLQRCATLTVLDPLSLFEGVFSSLVI